MLLRVVAHREPQAICAKHGEPEGRNSQASEWLRESLQVGPLEFLLREKPFQGTQLLFTGFAFDANRYGFRQFLVANGLHTYRHVVG